jgi:signal transduction histidine kinase
MDVVAAAAVAAGTALVDAFGSLPGGAVGWDLLLAAPLVLRRQHPAWAAALIAAICLAQWLAGVRATGDVAFLLALYSLGAYERRRWILVSAVVIAEVGVIMAVTRWAPASNRLLPGLLSTGTVTAAWVAGIYVRMRRAYLVSALQRAETAERERDSRAQVAVAAERARMAREMHDVIAHSLSVMITLNDAATVVESSRPSPRCTGCSACCATGSRPSWPRARAWTSSRTWSPWCGRRGCRSSWLSPAT